MSAYVGIGGKTKKVNKIYVGVGGVSKKVMKAYVGVGGQAKLWWRDIGLAKTSPASGLTAASAGTASRNRGTVFNGRAIFAGRTGSSTDTCIIATYNTSLTKVNITSPQAYFVTEECGRLSSYAICCGTYNTSSGNSRNYSVSLNTSFTASVLSELNGNSVGSPVTQTSSYVIAFNYGSYDSDTQDWNVTKYSSVVNNSLTMTTITTNCYYNRTAGGFPNIRAPIGCACSFGNLAIYVGGTSGTNQSICTVNNSLTTNKYSNSQLFGSDSPKHVTMALVESKMFAGAYPNLYRMFSSSLTPTTLSAPSNRSSVRSYNMAAGALPDVVLFAGGGDGEDSSEVTNIVTAYNAEGTLIDSPPNLTTTKYRVQSSVYPVGKYVMFAGGCWGSSYYTTVDAYYEV